MSTHDITVRLETNHHPISSLHKFDLVFESSSTETFAFVACRLQELHFKMNQICNLCILETLEKLHYYSKQSESVYLKTCLREVFKIF